ncbi:MAG: hypothetical protein WA902_12030 [Thermosynechococcaceae cyanobacterium]
MTIVTVTGRLESSARTSVIAQPKPYPQVATDLFMDACTQDKSVPYSYCQCILNELQQTIGYDDLIADYRKSHKSPKSPLPPEFHYARTVCSVAELTASLKGKPSAAPLVTYPTVILQAFKQGCNSNGKASPQFCQCTIDELQQRLSLSEHTQLSWQLQQDSPTPILFPFAVRESVLFCSIKQGLSNMPETPDWEKFSI